MGATVLKLGSWNTITDAMVAHPASPTGAVLDLNDGQTWTLNDVGQGWGEGLDWGVARPDVYKAGNVRTVGQRVTRRNYGQNRQVRVHLFLGQLSSYSAYMTALHNLVATLEGISQSQPATLQVQVTGASSPVYLDCVEGHLITQYRELQLLQLLDDGVEVEFEARPFFRGPRQTLQNLCMNPGFEAPFGGGVATTPPGVFSDTFANTNAYSVVSGGAPSLSPANTYVDIVHADSPIRHYRLGETSGANAYDIGGMYQTGTYVAAPTLGAAGLIAGDTDPAVTLNGTTQYATIPTTGLPTGANPWSIEAWAKPSSGTAGGAICSFGDSGSNGRSVTLAQLSAGGWQVFTWGGTVVSGGTSAAGVIHHVVATFDGVNLRLFVDGALVAGPTAPGVTVNVSGTHAAIGALYNGSYGSFFGGTVDEVAIYGSALSGTQVSSHYTAGHTGATGTVANAMSIPAAGQVKFGSPAWGAMQTWQTRFRFVTGLTNASFYLHYTDANNYLRAWVSGTTLNLEQKVAGTTNTLATAVTIALTHEAWYWMQITQFPSMSANQPYIQALLLSDNEGAVGAQVASIGAASTFDAVTAMTGVASLAATGATLAIGGNFTNTHAFFPFGPGAWSFASSGTGVASGAWDGAPIGGLAPTANNLTTNCYNGGPVTSYGCARLDVAPAGTLNAQWQSATALVAANIQQSAIPISAAGNVLGVSAWVKSSGVGAGCAQSLSISEYDTNGSFLRTNAVSGATVSGAQASWHQLSGTYTTGASCAYAVLLLIAADGTSGSASGTVWFDNVSVYNQTTTGATSMPYCELRFPNSPAQLMVSGVLGDVPALTVTQLMTYFTTWNASQTATVYCGRRATTTVGMLMVTPSFNITPTLDSASYGGFVMAANAGPLPMFASDANGGVFEILARAKTANATPANVSVLADTVIVRSVAGQSASYNYITATTTLGEYIGPAVNPFTAMNTWTLLDVSRVALPPTAQSSLTDTSQVTIGASTQSTPGGSTAITANWFALVPVDGDIFIARLINQGGGNYSQQWMWLYIDAAQQVTAFSIGSVPLPAPSSAAVNVVGGNFDFTPVVAPTAGSTIRLDPTLKTPNGGSLGVNQFVAVATDNLVTVQAVGVEIVYSPLYLYPN